MSLIRSAALVIGVAVGGVRGVVRGLRDPAPAAGPPRAEHPIKAVGKLGWRSWGLIVILLGAFAAVGGAVVVISGVVPIKASSGHWPITAWFLHFSMKRSIATHSFQIEAPELNDPALVLKGAGHYDYGCRPCHGSPELHQPRVAAAMTPHPPYLPPVLSRWQPNQLFYLVKHGVKFTGMPAWPSQQRDDEVWAMVAFLQRLPSLNTQEYRTLSSALAATPSQAAPMQDLDGPEGVPSVVTESCGRCHGIEGSGRGTGAFPKIGGQHPQYLYASLRAYADGQRHSGVMQPLAAALQDHEMRQVALYYGGRAQGRSERVIGDVALGAAIARGGLPERRIPACNSCHFHGAAGHNPIYPELAGQYQEYILLQLELFKAEHRGGTPYWEIMREVVKWLEPDEMRAVAAYYASMEPH